MTTTARRTLAALALTLLAGTAAAATDTGNLALDVQSAVSGEGIVNVHVRDGVATLTGHASEASQIAAEATALRHEDVDSVVNLIQEGE